MSGLGEFAKFIGYFILCIPPIGVLIFFGILSKRSLKVWVALFLISITPLSIYGYKHYNDHHKEEQKYVGQYYLTEYPDCEPCTLKLSAKMSYSVFHNENEIESGKWKYRSGSDYWIVDIGEHGQLGSGKFKYSSSSNGFEKK